MPSTACSDLAVAVPAQAGRGGLAGALDGGADRATAADPAVSTALPAAGKKGPPRAATILSKQTLPQQSPAQAARPAHRQLALVGNTTVPRATPTRSILYNCSRPSPSKVPLAFTSRSINPVVRILGSDLTIFAKGRHSRTGGLFGLGHGSASDPGRGSCDRLRPGSGTCLPETLLKAWCSTSPGISSRIIWMLPMASWV